MGVSSQRHAPAALYTRWKYPRYPLDRWLSEPPETVWTQGLEEKSFAPVGDRTPIVQHEVPHRQYKTIFSLYVASVTSTGTFKYYYNWAGFLLQVCDRLSVANVRSTRKRIVAFEPQVSDSYFALAHKFEGQARGVTEWHRWWWSRASPLPTCYCRSTIWRSLKSALSSDRLETALADSHVFVRRVASFILYTRAVFCCHSTTTFPCWLSDHSRSRPLQNCDCKLDLHVWSSNEDLATTLQVSTRTGAYYVTRRRGQVSLNRNATLVRSEVLQAKL
jgi:hypothetical protein